MYDETDAARRQSRVSICHASASIIRPTDASPSSQVLKHVTMEQTPAQKLLYRQVVLVGDASDTRAYRLPWPTGTCIYHVASKEGHEWAEGAAKAAGLHVKRGCLLKRVAVDLAGSESGWCDKLISAGLQPDKVAVFAIQVTIDITSEISRTTRSGRVIGARRESQRALTKSPSS